MANRPCSPMSLVMAVCNSSSFLTTVCHVCRVKCMLSCTCHTTLMSTCDLPLPWLSPTIGAFANPRGRSSKPPLPEKCQLWLQGLPVGTVCPRLAAPVPLICVFACQPLLHTTPVTTIAGQLQSKYMHAEVSIPSIRMGITLPVFDAMICSL